MMIRFIAAPQYRTLIACAAALTATAFGCSGTDQSSMLGNDAFAAGSPGVTATGGPAGAAAVSGTGANTTGTMNLSVAGSNAPVTPAGTAGQSGSPSSDAMPSAGSLSMVGGAGGNAVATTGGAGGAGGMSSIAGASGSAGMAEPAAAGMGAAGAAGEPAPMDGKPPFMATGMPIMAPEKTWTTVPFDEAKCRSGSAANIRVSMSTASKNVMIYLEGGGACFDSQTCGANPADAAGQGAGTQGIWDRNNAQNPVKDWSFVYVPYCTGDVHMGANPNGQVSGVSGTQQFVGRLNLKAFLNRLVPTFASAEQVLLTGSSAGGFGASANAEFVQWAFGSIPVTMIDDSGPTMSNMFLPKCLTDTYRKTWGLDRSILEDCGSDCTADGDYSIEYLEHVARASAGHSSGLIESSQDAVIRGFFGIGTNNGKDDCMGALLLTSMDAQQFLNGLLDYRQHIMKFEGMSTYYPNSDQHTWLNGATFYTQTTGGVKMVDWFTDVLQGKPATQIGPM